MSTPKVSVIVPVYNVEAYLPECLDSVLSQTLTDIEVICINDGSPDGSLAILRRYEQADSRVKVIDKKNEGVGKARNDGIAAAKGEYIAFMDSDDWYPNHTTLETMYTAAKTHNVKIAGGYYQKHHPNGTVEDAKPSFDGLSFAVNGKTAYKDYQYDYGYTAYIFETAMLQNNRILFPPYGRFQDPPFFVQAMIAAGEFYALDAPTYCYRMVPSGAKYSGSKTLDMLKGIGDNLRVSKEHGLAKLHYLTACRLDTEASFMVMQNVYGKDRDALLAAFLKTAVLIDDAWVREEGYPLRDPFVPQLITDIADTAALYEALRATKARKLITWLPRKLFR